MRINDDHMYHGSALTQLAEHPQFTAINALHKGAQKSRSAFRVNDDVGIYLKYATAATKPFDEYPFTFLQQHIDEVEALFHKTEKVYVILVCVQAKQICCIRRNELQDLLHSGSSLGATMKHFTPFLSHAPRAKALECMSMSQV